MDKSAIVKLGDIRNIIDQTHITEIIKNVIENKQLTNYPHIQKWLNSNLKNYLIQQHPLKEIVDIHDFPQIVQELIERKNIQRPYHEVDVSAEFMDKLNHIIDYLKSDFPVEKDLSRISFEQSKINADSWLSNRLRRLNGEEDPEFVIPMMEFIHKGKEYKWVNLRSHKALKRESFMMNHCIETYWEQEYSGNEVINSSQRTNFYSLRDEHNNSIITIHAIENENSMVVHEIKEKNNQFLTHENRLLTDILFKNEKFKNNRLLEFQYYEAPNSKYFLISPSNRDYIKDYLSLNEIVERKLMSLKNISIDFEEIKEYYPLNDVIDLFKFKHLKINQETKETEQAIIVEKIEINGIRNKTINIESNDVAIRNVENSTIIINSKTDVNKPITIYVENARHIIINHQVDKKGAELNYIIKDSSLVNVINLSKMDFIKIIEIDSEKNQIKKEDNKRFKKISINHEKINFDLSEYAYKISNNSISKAYETALKHCLPMYFNYLKEHQATKEEIIYFNMLKDLVFSFEISNEYFKDMVFKINNQNIQSSNGMETYETLVNLIQYPIDTIKRLNENFGTKKMISCERDFLEENLYRLIVEDKLTEFKDFSDNIKANISEIEKILSNNRHLYKKILTEDNDDLFTNYAHKIRDDLHWASRNINYNLFFEMLKNDMLEMTIKAKEKLPLKNISYRFNFEEQRLKNFFARRLEIYFGKDNQIDIFKQPYTPNSNIKARIENITSKLKP